MMFYPYILVKCAQRNGIDATRIAAIIACSILLFFMALRANTVGVDTKYYSYVFTQFRDISWGDVFHATLYGEQTQKNTFTFDFEPGYRLLNKIISMFFVSPQAITVVNSLLIILLLYRIIQAESPMILLSIWLYITLGIYQTEMNVSRNAIAIFICFLAFRWIRERKVWFFILYVFIAATFHQTAFFFLPVYWLVNYFKLNRRRMVLLIAVSCLVGLKFDILVSMFGAILPSRYTRYLIDSSFSLKSILVGVFSAVLCGLVSCFMNRNERETVMDKLSVGNWMFVLNMCFFGINLGIEAGARVAALFGPYMICYIPQMINEIESPQRRKTVIWLVVAVSFIQYVIRLQINNIGGTMPYLFFWN